MLILHLSPGFRFLLLTFTSDTLRSYFFQLFAEVGRTRSMDAHKNSIRNAAIFFVRFIIYIAPFYDIFIFLYSLSFHATSSISFACMICKTAVYITPLLCAQPFITWYFPLFLSLSCFRGYLIFTILDFYSIVNSIWKPFTLLLHQILFYSLIDTVL